MKTDKIFWGILLVFIGGIFLLENFGVIDFSWHYVWKFWPVILILVGVNILFANSKSRIGLVVVAVITVITLGILTFKGLEHRPNKDNWSWTFSDDEAMESDSSAAITQATYSEEFDTKYKSASLNVKGGASKFIIESGTDKLFEANLRETKARYYLRKTETDSSVNLNFNSKGNATRYSFGDDDFNEVKMMLNTQPIWDINLTMGAGEIDFDFTDYKVRNIALKGGAASFNVKVGDLFNNVNITAETGVAEVKIKVPEGSGCQIKSSTGLSSKDFKGFINKGNGTFETTNYNSAPKKIHISLKGGLSDFNVDRY